MTTEIAEETKFFVELPADEHGNISMRCAVVEARVVEENYREKLIPVAPEYFVRGWPNGWYRDTYGGWAETTGPGRMLEREEYQALLRNLPSDDLVGIKNNLVTLKNGDIVPSLLVAYFIMSLRDLSAEDPIAFYELVMTARNRQHVLFGSYGEELIARSLLESVDEQQHGHMHDIVRSIVVSAVQGEDMDMVLTSPTAV